MEDTVKVEYRKGNDSLQDEFIDLINYVFHMNGKDSDFYRLLPKLYKKECHPCGYNFMALEDGKIKAAVGSFPGTVKVCGMTLTYSGIGNVAVHPYSRSKGYMKELMKQAVEQMKEDDADFSVLGGRRHRYSYFSYETAGRLFSFWMDENNIRHALGKGRKERFRFSLVNGNDTAALKSISQLQQKQPLFYERKEDKLFDILKNWAQVDIYGIYEEQRFAGYLLCYNKNYVREIMLDKKDDITEAIAEFGLSYATDGLTVEIPDYQCEFAEAVSFLAEEVTIKDNQNYSVFHYDRVIEAFLRLKSQTDKLADGEVVLFIHGKKKDEKLLITVKDNIISVTPTDQNTEYEYTHLEAMSLLFGTYSPLRSKLPMEVQTWLPLPIFMFPADGV
jgi:predicted acetyltransferase